VFLTDMQDTSEDKAGPDRLLALSQLNAKSGVYCTFIGMGVDFNSEITARITQVQGIWP
jgi:hypothetical protein